MMIDRMTLSDPLESFAKRFLTGRVNWRGIHRRDAIINFGNIISLCLYRKDNFQVELFIVPGSNSSFTAHTHPDVDVMEFGLTGEAALFINGARSCSTETVHNWLDNVVDTSPIRIRPTDVHYGYGITPYAFLSIQVWLNGVKPTSVGLNWQGLPASLEQAELLMQQR